MNKQELFEKALNEFNKWPYVNRASMVYDIHGGVYADFYGASDDGLNESWFSFVCTREEFESAKAERSKKFTKEFNVRGGTNVPEVWQPCEVLFSGTRYIVVKNENGREFSRRKAKIKIRDIDKRTDKEKAVDDMLMRINKREHLGDILGFVYDKWVGDKK